MQYEPLRDLVLLKAKRTEEKSESGLLYIPEQCRDTLNEGCIVAIGPDVPTHEMFNGTDSEVKGKELLKEGDTVVFGKHSEYRIEIDGEVYIAVQYSNILLRKI